MQILPNFLKHYTITELERQIYDVHFPWHYPQAEGEPDQYVNLLYYDPKIITDIGEKNIILSNL